MRASITFKLYRKALKEKIKIAPGQIFSTGDQFQNYMRISFGIPLNEGIEDGLGKLGNMI